MPTYSYSCDACGENFEMEQRITADPIKTCPKCGRDTARRMISSGNFILKGGGWYADGYGSSASNGGANLGKAASGGSGGESKPAAASKDASSSTSSSSTTAD